MIIIGIYARKKIKLTLRPCVRFNQTPLFQVPFLDRSPSFFAPTANRTAGSNSSMDRTNRWRMVSEYSDVTGSPAVPASRAPACAVVLTVVAFPSTGTSRAHIYIRTNTYTRARTTHTPTTTIIIS